ncbi:LysR family transcriptional regulator (plasmid) [Leisingera sp. M527]|uniref:LysR family transcriptional regulator n=1 Tax=Leisingera sp. M527 TaxID=2867014 RepID=UPI0021A93AC5|nr:LysR family transcriptional regulator [Leisingera sp. M527]UWQ35409.1 LysR family transcriptional regulator [Leisingera sp. M527]
MRKLPNLIWLRSFESAAQHLSFTEAAQELGLTQTAVSLHVRSLEAELGCKLFTRAARRLTLTEVGKAYAYSLRQALGDMAFSTASLFGAEAEQMLTVRVQMSTAGLWLAHRLPEFAALHPGIPVRLVTNIWAGSDAPENVDVELRFGSGSWDGVAVKKISKERLVPICATGGCKLSPERLRRGPLVQILGFEDMLLRYLNAYGLAPAKEVARFAVDTTVAAIDIVAAGGGFAVVLERFAQTAIETGKPITIAGEPLAVDQAHYLLHVPATASNDAAKQLFEAWLEASFQ